MIPSLLAGILFSHWTLASEKSELARISHHFSGNSHTRSTEQRFSPRTCEKYGLVRHAYLTWQHDPCRTITVNIHGVNTDERMYVYYDTCPHDSEIKSYPYSISGNCEPKSFPDGRKLYHLEIKGLTPGTSYYFTVGNRNRSLCPEKKFRTVPDDPDAPLCFIEGGDWENTQRAKELACRAAQCNPYAVWLGGDYPSRVFSKRSYRKWDEWLDVYTQCMVTHEGNLIPLVMAIGNHEVVGKEEVPFYFSLFKQGDRRESFFSLTFGPNLRLFVLDSGHYASHSGIQLDWLRNELEQSKAFPVKAAIYHVPLYPSIRFANQDFKYKFVYRIACICYGKDKADKLFSEASSQGRMHWLPLFDQYNLTVAFEHHDQTLKRTKLLKRGKENPEGTLYLGDGGWGPENQYFPIQKFFHSHFARLIGKVHFFWVMTVEKEKITYTAMNQRGEAIDRFVQNLNRH